MAFFLSRVNYLLRSSPLYTNQDSLQAIDSFVLQTFSERISTGFTDDSWEEASLPIHFGALGVLNAVNLTLPCFLPSMHTTHEPVSDLLRASENHSDVIEHFHEPYSIELPTGEAAQMRIVCINSEQVLQSNRAFCSNGIIPSSLTTKLLATASYRNVEK